MNLSVLVALVLLLALAVFGLALMWIAAVVIANVFQLVWWLVSQAVRVTGQRRHRADETSEHDVPAVPSSQ